MSSSPGFTSNRVQHMALFDENGTTVEGITYLLKVLFSTADATPLTNPYVGETGSLAVAQVDGTLAAASGALTNTAQASPVEGDLGVWDSVTRTRTAGRTFYVKITPGTLNTYPLIFWGVNLNASSVGMEAALGIQNPLIVNDGGSLSIGKTLANSTQYEVWLILLATGAYAVIKGGVFTNAELVWKFRTGSTAAMVAAIGYWNGVASVQDLAVVDLPAAILSAIAIASVSSFAQSISAEMLANPSFVTWAADNPSSWTVQGESGSDPMVTQVASGGGAGTGAARLYSSATGFSPVLRQNGLMVVGGIYEVRCTISAAVAGSFNVGTGDGVQVTAYSTTGAKCKLIRALASGAGLDVAVYGIGTTPNDMTFDDVSLKRITLNTAQAMPADAEFYYTFVLPVSPATGDEIHLLYRIEAAGDELLDCWDAYLRRNAANDAWDFRVDSIVAGTRTNRVNTTGVGDVTTIAARCKGSDHDYWTLVSTTWTKRGATISVATYSTAVLCNTIAGTGFTETSLEILRVDLSSYESSLYTATSP